MNSIRNRIACLILAALFLCLCGCGLIRQTKQSLEAAQAESDEILVEFMTCIENNDLEGACALAYDPAQMRKDFSALRSYWPASGTDPYESRGLNINTNLSKTEGRGSTASAAYLVNTGGEDYQVNLVIRHDENGDGLYSLNAVRTQELTDSGVEPITGNDPVPKKSFGQWCFTGFWLLSCLFCLITVIDILRKKPRRYGLWIVIALLFFGGHLYRGPGGIQAGINIGLLNTSEWIRYYGGASRYQLCLPFGAISYWIERRRLLKKAAQTQYAVPVDETTPE